LPPKEVQDDLMAGDSSSSIASSTGQVVMLCMCGGEEVSLDIYIACWVLSNDVGRDPNKNSVETRIMMVLKRIILV